MRYRSRMQKPAPSHPLPASTCDSPANLADQLNLACACQTLEPQRLREQLETSPALQGLTERLTHSHPHLFSATAVFLDAQVHAQLVQAVSTLERVMALPGWQAQALAQAPAIAQHNWGPAGVFMGYDFHLAAEGPKLIEINSNAGGGWLNAALARAHRLCSSAAGALAPTLDNPEEAFIRMFHQEWQAQRGPAPLRSVLIVDDAPEQQYLAPEFEMARALFASHGLQAVVADARDLQWHDGALWHPALPPGMPVDMVYNRLTDFYLEAPEHAALKQAFEAGACVVTPSPRTHALYANKRHLAPLSDRAQLQAWGASADDCALLQQVVPATQRVQAAQADALWAQRRQLFFKPATGFGSRAAYRGDKLTRRVWADILAGDYVAQAHVPPSERLVRLDDHTTRLKLDLRAYSYQGQIQLLAARTWAGQTTNFRTEGGGFSPVVVLPHLPQHSATRHAEPEPSHR
ncbi:MAG: hypothetical protein RLZZ352_913 [Pseudomonadota bacterium]|jgi:hypothetical protein